MTRKNFAALLVLTALLAGCGIFSSNDNPRGVLSYDVPEQAPENRPEIKDIAKQSGSLPGDSEKARYTNETLKPAGE